MAEAMVIGVQGRAAALQQKTLLDVAPAEQANFLLAFIGKVFFIANHLLMVDPKLFIKQPNDIIGQIGYTGGVRHSAF